MKRAPVRLVNIGVQTDTDNRGRTAVRYFGGGVMSGEQLRLSKAEFKSLMEMLNQADASGSKSVQRRKHKRYGLPTGWSIVVELHQPGSLPAKFPGVLRDISRGGASMLYVGFVHSGATVKFCFRGPEDGLNLFVDGKVVRCRHVKAHIHEIGVRFATDLPIEFLVPSERAESTASTQDYGRISQFVDLIGRAVKNQSPIATIRQLVDELQSDLAKCEVAGATRTEREAA